MSSPETSVARIRELLAPYWGSIWFPFNSFSEAQANPQTAIQSFRSLGVTTKEDISLLSDLLGSNMNEHESCADCRHNDLFGAQEPLSEIAEKSGFERRLINLLRKHEGTRRFPFKYVQDVVFSPERALAEFTALRNSGAKTQESFVHLVTMLSRSYSETLVRPALSLPIVANDRVHAFAEQLGCEESIVNVLRKREGTAEFPYLVVRDLLPCLGEPDEVLGKLDIKKSNAQASFGFLHDQLLHMVATHIAFFGLAADFPELKEIRASVLADRLSLNRRVVNLLQQHEGRPEFPFTAVGDLLDSPIEAVELFRALPSTGRSSLESFEVFLDILTPHDTQGPPSSADGPVEDYVDGEPLSSLGARASNRLGSRLAEYAGSEEFPYSTVGECLSDKHACIEALSDIPGIGRGSLVEFQELLKQFIRPSEHNQFGLLLPVTSPTCRIVLKDQFVGSGFPASLSLRRLHRIEDNLGDAPVFYENGDTPTRRFKQALSKVDRQMQESQTNGIGQSADQRFYQSEFESALVKDHYSFLAQDLREYLSVVLEARDREVLSGRLCSNPKRGKTLEALGEDLNITRERVRQIENKIIQKAERASVKRLISLVNESVQDLFSHVFRSFGGYIEPDDLNRIELSPAIWLLLNVTFQRFGEVLDAYGTRIGAGWVSRSDADRAADLERDDALSSTILGMAPCTIAQIGRAFSLREFDAKLLVRLKPELKEESDIVVPARFRAGMIAKLSELLLTFRSESSKGRAFPYLSSIARGYTEQTGKRIANRDLVNTLRRAPSLFTNLFDQYWGCLAHPISSASEGPCFDVPAEDMQYRWKVPTEENTLQSFLRRILSQAGPLSLSELRERAAGLLSEDHALTSVLPVAITFAEFVRVIPGVVCLAEELLSSDLANRLERFASIEWQIRVYIQARRSEGAVANAFPGWTHEYERLIGEHLRQCEHNVLFSSFLSVCQPEGWDVSEMAKRYWTQQVQTKARYELFEWLRVQRVDVTELQTAVLPAILVGYKNGSLSWMDCNRLTGTRIDSHKGSALLAYMVLQGYLRAAPHWQEPHACSIDPETLDELVTRHIDGSFSYRMTTTELQQFAESNWGQGWTDHVQPDELLSFEAGEA